jgi:hypothetical protein
MPRSRIEIYWKKIETVPAGVAVQVRVTDGSDHDYLLPYPCKLMEGTWVNAVSGTPLAVRPTYWKLYVETLPGKKTWKRGPPAELCLLAISLWGCLFWPEREPEGGCRLRGLPASQAARVPGPDELGNISKSK